MYNNAITNIMWACLNPTKLTRTSTDYEPFNLYEHYGEFLRRLAKEHQIVEVEMEKLCSFAVARTRRAERVVRAQG